MMRSFSKFGTLIPEPSKTTLVIHRKEFLRDHTTLFVKISLAHCGNLYSKLPYDGMGRRFRLCLWLICLKGVHVRCPEIQTKHSSRSCVQNIDTDQGHKLPKTKKRLQTKERSEVKNAKTIESLMPTLVTGALTPPSRPARTSKPRSVAHYEFCSNLTTASTQNLLRAQCAFCWLRGTVTRRLFTKSCTTFVQPRNFLEYLGVSCTITCEIAKF